MTSPSDFLDIDRMDDDGGKQHEKIEEAWDEPHADCLFCGKPFLDVNDVYICPECEKEDL